MPPELAHKAVPPERTTMLLCVSRLLRAYVQRLRAPASIQVRPGQCARHVCAALDRMLEASAYTITSLDISKLRASMDGEDWPGVLSRCVELRRLVVDEDFFAGGAPHQLALVLQPLVSLGHLGIIGEDLDLARGKNLACVLSNGMRCTRLHLRFQKITARGAETFAAGLGTCGALTELVLDHCKVHTDGVRHLAAGIAHCTGLTKLCMGMTAMRDHGATALSTALCALTALEHLKLACNFFAQEGTTRLAAGLLHCSKLQHLDLSSNECGRAGVAALQPFFQQCSGLHTLRLASAEMGNFGAASMDRSLPALCALRQLNLCSNLIQGGGWKKIASVIARCAKLCVNMNQFKDAGVASMKTSWSLNGPLVHLDMRSNGLSAQGLAMLADVLSRYDKLTDLDLSNNYVLGRSGCEVLADCFAQLTGLERLTVRHCGLEKCNMDMLAHQLERFTALACLHLGGNHVWGRSTKVLARALGTCTTLRELGLEDVKFGPYGMHHLAQSLVRCTGLERLNVAGNRIGQAGVGQLVRVVGRCKRLRELNVSRNQFDKKAAAVLFRCLCKCPGLQTLDASRNPWGPKVVKRWAPLLAQASTLLSLNLMRCEMGNDGAAALAAWLPLCGPLCMLDLSWNCITAAGAAELAKALPSCASLARLYMTGNFVGHEGYSAIMQHLPARLALRL
jgi:Ran GTPase-activating protein (RanGAP) involved in mRNA processing and transport